MAKSSQQRKNLAAQKVKQQQKQKHQAVGAASLIQKMHEHNDSERANICESPQQQQLQQPPLQQQKQQQQPQQQQPQPQQQPQLPQQKQRPQQQQPQPHQLLHGILLNVERHGIRKQKTKIGGQWLECEVQQYFGLVRLFPLYKIYEGGGLRSPS